MDTVAEEGEDNSDEIVATTGIREPDPLRPVLSAMLPHRGGLAARRDLGGHRRTAAGEDKGFQAAVIQKPRRTAGQCLVADRGPAVPRRRDANLAGGEEVQSCHTGYPYLLARTGSGDPEAPAARQVRSFFEDRVVAWDRGGKGTGYLKGNGSLKVSEGVTEVVAIAATLALHDARTTGKLHPLTRRALDRMWEFQQTDGSWSWNKTGLCRWSAMMNSEPSMQRSGPGTPRPRTPGPTPPRMGLIAGIPSQDSRLSLHHKAWLLWASIPLDDLMTPAEASADDQGPVGPTARRWRLESQVAGRLETHGRQGERRTDRKRWIRDRLDPLRTAAGKRPSDSGADAPRRGLAQDPPASFRVLVYALQYAPMESTILPTPGQLSH